MEKFGKIIYGLQTFSSTRALGVKNDSETDVRIFITAFYVRKFSNSFDVTLQQNILKKVTRKLKLVIPE